MSRNDRMRKAFNRQFEVHVMSDVGRCSYGDCYGGRSTILQREQAMCPVIQSPARCVRWNSYDKCTKPIQVQECIVLYRVYNTITTNNKPLDSGCLGVLTDVYQRRNKATQPYYKNTTQYPTLQFQPKNQIFTLHRCIYQT